MHANKEKINFKKLWKKSPYTFLVAIIKWHLCECAILGLQGALESSDSEEKMLSFGVGLNITYREF